jgi:hypothetical protein
VSDSGCGVAESDLPQLFKEGVSIGKAEGSGIGLWSARQILKGFGGEITVASGQSKGGSLSGYSTTVQIRLNNFEDKCLVGPSLSVSNYEKIIIVDDDASFREVILDKFEDFEGCMEVFPSLALLKKYVSLNDACNKTLFLVDNSFRGVSEKGADFLIKNPQLDAILVTNHYTDTSTLLACREGGLKYLPKPLVNILSVSYTD